MTGPSPATALRRTSTLLELGRWQEAAQEVARYLATDPQDTRALCMHAQALLGTGDLDGALRSAGAAAATAPSEEWPHRLASLALQRLGRTDEAVVAAERSVQAAPFLAVPHVRLAQALLAQGRDLHRARGVAGQAVSMAPHLVEAHIAVGGVAAAQRRLGDAEAAFRHALAMDPQNSVAHNELARLHLRRRRGLGPGQLAAAASGFRDAVRVDPTQEVARRNLDLVVFAAIQRVAWFLLIAAWIGRALADGTDVPRGALWIPPALVLLPLAFATAFVVRLDPALRRYLVRRLRGPAVGLPVVTVAVVTCLMVLGAALPATTTRAFDGGAVLAVLLRLGLFIHGSRAGFVRFGRRR